MICSKTQTRLVATIALALGAAVGQPAAAGNLVPGGWAEPVHVAPPAPQPPDASARTGRPLANPPAHRRAKPAVSRQPAQPAPAGDGTIRY